MQIKNNYNLKWEEDRRSGKKAKGYSMGILAISSNRWRREGAGCPLWWGEAGALWFLSIGWTGIGLLHYHSQKVQGSEFPIVASLVYWGPRCFWREISCIQQNPCKRAGGDGRTGSEQREWWTTIASFAEKFGTEESISAIFAGKYGRILKEMVKWDQWNRDFKIFSRNQSNIGLCLSSEIFTALSVESGFCLREEFFHMSAAEAGFLSSGQGLPAVRKTDSRKWNPGHMSRLLGQRDIFLERGFSCVEYGRSDQRNHSPI